jgi:hypothetical protein
VSEVEEIDYSSMLPTEPPKGLLLWLKMSGKLQSEVLIYKSAYINDPRTGMKEKVVECHCSECTETFYLDYAPAAECSHSMGPFGFIDFESGEAVRDGMSALCPNCRSMVKVFHIGSIRYDKTLEEYWPITVQAVDGHLAIICWYVSRVGTKNGQTRNVVRPWEAYLTVGKKMIKLVAYQKFTSSISFLGGWQQRKRCTDGLTNIDFVMPWDPQILIGTDAENCKLDLFMRSDDQTYPVTYLRIWQRHPNIENLIVQGAGILVNNMIHSQTYSGGYYGQSRICRSTIEGVDWSQKRPAQMLGLTKDEFKIAVSEKWKSGWLDFYRRTKAVIRPEDVKQCYKFGFINVEDIMKRKQDPMKAIRYIMRQKKKYKAASVADLGYLIDYWNMAGDLHEDLRNPEIAYPQNIVTAHDTMMMRKKYQKTEISREKFVKRYLQLQKFCWASDGLEIHPARSQFEMIQEGKVLHHCVATYSNKVAEGKTAIFFIRRSNDPETPYFTLELDEKSGKVLQNRGMRNCNRTDEVEAFEKKWIERVKNIIEREKQNGKRNEKRSKKPNSRTDAA